MVNPWGTLVKSYVVNSPMDQVAERLGDLFMHDDGILDGPPLKGEYYDFPKKFLVTGGSGKFSLLSLVRHPYGTNDRYPFWDMYGEVSAIGNSSTQIEVSVKLNTMGKIGVVSGLLIVMTLVFTLIRSNVDLKIAIGYLAVLLLWLYIFTSSRRQLISRFEDPMELGD